MVRHSTFGQAVGHLECFSVDISKIENIFWANVAISQRILEGFEICLVPACSTHHALCKLVRQSYVGQKLSELKAFFVQKLGPLREKCYRVLKKR